MNKEYYEDLEPRLSIENTAISTEQLRIPIVAIIFRIKSDCKNAFQISIHMSSQTIAILIIKIQLPIEAISV